MLYRLHSRQTWKIYSWKAKDNRIDNNAREHDKIKRIVLDNKITRIKHQMLFILFFFLYFILILLLFNKLCLTVSRPLHHFAQKFQTARCFMPDASTSILYLNSLHSLSTSRRFLPTAILISQSTQSSSEQSIPGQAKRHCPRSRKKRIHRR